MLFKPKVPACFTTKPVAGSAYAKGMNTKGTLPMNHKTTSSTTLINSAFALVDGWESRRISRTTWHKADALMMQAALIDPQSAMSAWEQLATEYEAYLQNRTPQRRAA
jgi:hypothetical protein